MKRWTFKLEKQHGNITFFGPNNDYILCTQSLSLYIYMYVCIYRGHFK